MQTVDHPGFFDTNYVERRNKIAEYATDYNKTGIILDINYNQKEYDTWHNIFNKVIVLHEKFACREYLDAFEIANLQNDKIPQLSNINDNLSKHVNFSLIPTPGIATVKDFLINLASNKMLCTQYIRHYSNPDYTPEPDIIHEMLGHVVNFFTYDYCELNKLFGEVSKTADDKLALEIERLYWHTLEFGLVKEGSTTKAYGAGLLSSAAELNQINNVFIKDFSIDEIIKTKYSTTNMQPILYCASSYNEMYDKLTEWLMSKVT